MQPPGLADTGSLLHGAASSSSFASTNMKLDGYASHFLRRTIGVLYISSNSNKGPEAVDTLEGRLNKNVKERSSANVQKWPTHSYNNTNIIGATVPLSKSDYFRPGIE
jgi:hypothetical protein